MTEVMVVCRCSIPANSFAEVAARFPEVVERTRSDQKVDGVELFNVEVLDSGTSEEAVAAAMAFLKMHRDPLMELARLHGACELDFGVLVGSEASYAPSIAFRPPLLAEAVSYGVDLRVSCYPTSDGEE